MSALGNREPAVVAPASGGPVPLILRRRHPLRWLASLIVLCLVALLIVSMVTNERYRWHVVSQFLFDSRVLSGLMLTLWLTGICMVLGTVLGTVLALGRLSANPLVSTVVGAYIWFFRGTPVLVQLVIWYNLAALYPKITVSIPFGGPELFSLNSNQLITPALAAIVGLSLDLAAYMAETIRNGILGVESGQTEAALSIGMTRTQTMRRIVLPQAIRLIVPPAWNQLIALLKYTSLVSVLAVSDLLYSAELISQLNYEVIPLLLVATIWYLVLTSILTLVQRYLERYFNRGVHPRRSRRKAGLA
ncbi:amino acid ABC transporter permease [Amycolatopsis jejuensis]|uniref:amino acid ABC transporter permease n=1 Tax=Amycolatopsis jejuensis TaxID=330084 RepID=UPI00068AF45D|nr:amino acid ABC transporter permease [Amycolatopsis jejuensis]